MTEFSKLAESDPEQFKKMLDWATYVVEMDVEPDNIGRAAHVLLVALRLAAKAQEDVAALRKIIKGLRIYQTLGGWIRMHDKDIDAAIAAEKGKP